MIGVPLEHLIGSGERIDVPRSCALVIQAITLVWRGNIGRQIALNSAIGKAFQAYRAKAPTVQLPFAPRSPAKKLPEVGCLRISCVFLSVLSG
jgi:hypothetical protein